MGMFSGIPIEEWDDAVNVQSKERLLYNQNLPLNYGYGTD